MAKYGEHSSAWELGQTGGGGAAAPGWDCWQLARGRGAPGGAAARTSQGEKRDHRPFHWLTGYMQDPLSRHTPGGPQVTPHPTQPCPGAPCVQVMLLCGCPD